MSKRLRCAIYTRKSTEEGLDQQFNSLQAQREACEAYILSQTGEGWSAIRTPYDDGGYSGGSMQRPGLAQLLEDIRKGLIDIVVVYKVDRLTRSLADFAKIVELFDQRGVSFVSVTQAFNTTTSMGRLTLNVLLSFAQFEREVTGERIRDKVAASKAKGLRMGGRPPLGYDIKDGRLVVNQAEAGTVRHIFRRYLELGSIIRLAEALRAEGIEAKRWTTKTGRVAGGGLMGRGPLYYLLTNPAYGGITRHKDKRYPGTHPAIIDEATLDQAQARLALGNGRQPKTPKRGEGALLDGRLFDDKGAAMVATHATRGSKRYRYYVSRAHIDGKGEAGSLARISAGMLENFLAERLAGADAGAVLQRIERVVLSDSELVVTLAPANGVEAGPIRLPFHMRKRRAELVMVGEQPAPHAAPALDRALIRALVLARLWAARLEAGELASVRELAKQERLCVRYTGRLLPLAYLAPDLTAAILEGRQPRSLTLSALTAKPLPLDWVDQRRLVGSL